MNSKSYRGKVKIVDVIDDKKVKITFLDDITAGDGAKKSNLEGKGALNLELSHKLMMLMKEAGIPQHTIEKLSDNEIIAHNLKIVPLEVVVRNVIAGSFARRYGLEEGTDLKKPIVEFFLKDDELHDPLIDENVALNQNYTSRLYLDLMKVRALQVNKIVSEYFKKAGMLLVDFKLEFGTKYDGELLVADELSADSMRVWDIETREKLDKDRFRKDLGDVLAGYRAILARLENIEYEPEPAKMLATIFIQPKPGVNNPAGEVTKRTLQNADVPGLEKVLMGKQIQVVLNDTSSNKWIKSLEKVAYEVLTNPLIEIFSIRAEYFE